MAMSRLVLKNLHQKVSASSASVSLVGCAEKKRWWENEIIGRKFSTAGGGGGGGEEVSEKKDVTVTEGDKKSKVVPRRRGRRALWRDNENDFVPAGLFGLGSALMQATENINRLFSNLNISPSQLIGRVREEEQCYKLRYEVPGLPKEELKITINDGILTIKGEHKEDDEYEYYNTTLMLPDDAKVDEIKAELKDGVLTITIPRSEEEKKDVKEIPIH